MAFVPRPTPPAAEYLPTCPAGLCSQSSSSPSRVRPLAVTDYARVFFNHALRLAVNRRRTGKNNTRDNDDKPARCRPAPYCSQDKKSSPDRATARARALSPAHRHPAERQDVRLIGIQLRPRRSGYFHPPRGPLPPRQGWFCAPVTRQPLAASDIASGMCLTNLNRQLRPFSHPFSS